jgi:MFS transporter, ACS family, D-galactonate transporter
MRHLSSQEQPRSAGFRILLLLGLAILINYIDRSNLSIAAPLLKDELCLSATQLGTLLSAFFWAYTCLQIPCGWLVDHFEVKWVLALGFLLWCAATAVTSALHGFAGLLAVRVILGIGESVAVPASVKIIGTRFTERERGFAGAIVLTGLSLGPCVGILVGGTAIARFGWRPFFLALGLIGLLWLLPWLAWMPRTTPTPTGTAGPNGAFRLMLLNRSAWGLFVEQFCYNYCSYLLITWLPFYLVRGRNFSLARMTKIGALVFLLAAISAALWGKLSDRWICAGHSPTRVRKTVLILGQTVLGVSLIASPLVPDTLCPWILAAVGVCQGWTVSNMWAISQTLAGPRRAGRWMGMQNFVGNLAGFVAPALTGFLLDRTGKFHWPFFIAGAVVWAGALCMGVVVGPLEEIASSTAITATAEPA